MELWRYATSKTSSPDSTLKLAVQGREHISLTPSNYDQGARVPSKNCCLRIRDTIWRGFQELTNAPEPYRMQGKKQNIKLPPPTAADKDGARIDPVQAIQLRVEAKYQGIRSSTYPQ